MRFRVLIGSLALVAVLAGCGGGGGSSTASAPTLEKEFSAGDLVGRAAVSNPPVTSNSPYVVATAFTGTISSLKLRELNPSLAETRIFYSGNAYDQADIFSIAPDGSGLQRITNSSFADFAPAVSATGKIAFVSTRDGNTEIYLMNQDGSGQTRLTNAVGFDIYPTISSNGAKIAFVSDRTGSFLPSVLDVATQVVTPVTTDTAVWAAITQDASKVYFTHNAGSSYKVGVVSAAGGVPNYFYDSPNALQYLAVSPDGTEVAFEELVVGHSRYHRYNVSAGKDVYYDLPAYSSSVSYSPDGQQIVVGASDSTSSYGLYKITLDGSMTRITNKLSDANLPSWGPFNKERTLIAGGGGTLGTRAVGLVYGQKGSQTTSVLAFDATTPSSVVMTKQTGLDSNAPNLVFSCDADNITKMAYANSNTWQGIRIIGSGTPVLSANGALISMDAFSGQIVSILPFTGTRATGSKPTVWDEGGTRVFTGQFLAVYDSKGQNLAPGGANAVRLNIATGQLTAN